MKCECGTEIEVKRSSGGRSVPYEPGRAVHFSELEPGQSLVDFAGAVIRKLEGSELRGDALGYLVHRCAATEAQSE